LRVGLASIEIKNNAFSSSAKLDKITLSEDEAWKRSVLAANSRYNYLSARAFRKQHARAGSFTESTVRRFNVKHFPEQTVSEGQNSRFMK